MTIGELDTNLFTNQSLVGTTLESNSGKTIIEIEFYDYHGQPIIPTKSVIKEEDTENNYNVTTTPLSVTIGRYGNNPYHAMFSVEDNKLVATGAVTTRTTIITLMYHFRFLELQTSEKSYTKFKFIQ